jgi:1,4-dihydroxy-2-naphthoate octaprenyltransferase
MKHWIQAARLRTLPLSVSGIIVGSFYAMSQALFNWSIVILALLTTLGFQVLSNFANDYGDGIKGTDNEDRVGPKRTVQSGVISPEQMKNALIITSLLTLLSAIALIYVAFKDHNLIFSFIYLLLGILAIASAIKYTVGKSAYGYSGFGDVFVFIFFGLVSTLGIYFMFAKEMDWMLFLPATSIGFLSVAVLNLNNMRDEVSDRKSNKNTVVVKIGAANAKVYHYFLIVSALILILMFAYFKSFTFDQYLFVIAYFPLLKHLKTVYTNKNPKELDPELKKVALSTFALSLLLALSMIFFFQDLFVNLFLGGR